MWTRRCPARRLLPLAASLAALLAACATSQGGGRLGAAGGPASAAVPGSPAPTPAPPSASATAPVTTGATATHATTTHTRKPPPPPSPSASADPGDYSVDPDDSHGLPACSWLGNPSGTNNIAATFTIYYAGPRRPATVPYVATNDLTGAQQGGDIGTTGSFLIGFTLPAGASAYQVTIKLTVLPGILDDRPGDNAGALRISVPAGTGPTTGGYAPISCAPVNP